MSLRKARRRGRVSLTAGLTTSTPDSPPSGAISQVDQCQGSHDMPQPARLLQPRDHASGTPDAVRQNPRSTGQASVATSIPIRSRLRQSGAQ
jgi:hypothetical protein